MTKAIRSKDELRFTSTLEHSTNKLWGCHFRVPEDIVKQLVEDDSRRVVCVLNGSEQYQCAILSYVSGMFVITVNKRLREKLGLAFGDEVHVSLRKDSSKYGLPMPEELGVLFRQDKEGKRLFHALTPGKQRTLLYIICFAKAPEKRVTRAIAIVEHLKANGGGINYRQLNADIRNRLR